MILKWCIFLTLLSVYSCMEFRITKIRNRYKKAFLLDSVIHTSPRGIIKYKDGVMILVCTAFRPFMGAFPVAHIENKTIDYLSIEGCTFSQTPFKEELVKLKINTDDLETLEIGSIDMHPLPPSNYTSGLNIKNLFISAPACKQYLTNNPDFLEPLVNLKTLLVYRTEVPPIPSNIKLESLSIIGANITTEKWMNCEEMQELNITGSFEIPINILKDMPKDCKKLEGLSLNNFRRDDFNGVITGLNTGDFELKLLDIVSCEMDELPEKILQNSRHSLKHLNVHKNKLRDVSLAPLKYLQNLIDLDLSANELDGTQFQEWLKHLTKLKYLNLDGNKFTSILCNLISLYSDNASLSSLEHLSLNDVPNAPVDCFSNIPFPNLTYLGFSSNVDSEELKLQDIATSNAKKIVVDLHGRNIKRIKFDEDDFKALKNDGKKLKGTAKKRLVGLNIDCDCENYWLARAVREIPDFPFEIDFTCHSGNKIDKEPLINMDCIKIFDEGCVMRSLGAWGSDRRKLRAVDIECHGIKGNFNYPFQDEFYKIRTLNLSDNGITSLQNIKIRETLQWIDLRGNRITRLDVNDTNKLFDRKDLRIWLSGNQFICDCDNKHLIVMLHKHRKQIEDFEEITCINNGLPLSTITSHEACPVTFKLALVVVIILILCLMFWYCRFRNLTWNCCFLNSREEFERPFDVFLSYTHGEETHKVEKLLAKINNEPNKYRILIHLRDLVLEDPTFAKIMNSVHLSKRTIILLSKNNVESLSNLRKLRTVLEISEKEGKKRVSVLIVDDVETLPLEIHSLIFI